MELQGKQTTHDFLSLYKDSSFPRRDPSPPEQELLPKTHDFLHPLEGKRKITPTTSPAVASVDHLLHGGIGKFSITHLTDEQANRYSTAIKPEWPTCLSGISTVSSAASASATVVAAHDNRSSATHTGAAFTLWKEPPAKYKAAGAAGGEQQHQWSYSQREVRVSNSDSSFGSLLSGRDRSLQEKRRAMDAGSKSGKGFTDEDDDDEEFGRKELIVTVDRKSSQANNDQKPSTPRSKHSATEQRRRSKINDRFQILRDLIPHSDQKRDKASFLLEVIEYIRFLHEKVQKYESAFPEWDQENTKLKPWMNSHVALETTDNASQTLHNEPSASGLVFSGDNSGPVMRRMPENEQISLRTDNENSGLAHKTVFGSQLAQYGNSSGFVQPQQRLVENAENVASQSQSQWLRQCSGSAGDVLSDQELTIDEGTISISSAYSQGLLNALTEALQNSGLDLSQANISVQINLGKRAFSRSMSNQKDHEDPSSSNQAIGHSQMGNTIEELDQANKRHKSEKS